MKMTMTIRLLLVSFLALMLPATVTGLAWFLVESGKPKCMSVEVAGGTFLRIHFEAPDINVDKEDPTYGPTYLTFVEKPTATALDMEDGGGGRAPNNPKDRKQQQRRNEKQRQAKSKPMSHELDGKEGSTTVKVIQDSQANVCIRASTAGASNIMRFGLRIEELGEEDGGDDKGGQPPAADVDNHLSFMEKQLQRLEVQMHTMLKEADLSKERDSIYHLQTDAMHKATLFWPVLHVGILLLTGFTQANHIVQFFKKRHII